MSARARARDAWGEALPDWVAALAEACEASSQNMVAKDLGYTAGALSAVIGNKYAASTAQIEATVRGALMRETLSCPALGEIGKDVCARWRKLAPTFMNTNSQRITMHRACNQCPRHTSQEGSGC